MAYSRGFLILVFCSGGLAGQQAHLVSAGPEMTEQEFPLHCVLFCDNVRFPFDQCRFGQDFFFKGDLFEQAIDHSKLLEHSIKKQAEYFFFCFCFLKYFSQTISIIITSMRMKYFLFKIFIFFFVKNQLDIQSCVVSYP